MFFPDAEFGAMDEHAGGAGPCLPSRQRLTAGQRAAMLDAFPTVVLVDTPATEMSQRGHEGTDVAELQVLCAEAATNAPPAMLSPDEWQPAVAREVQGRLPRGVAATERQAAVDALRVKEDAALLRQHADRMAHVAAAAERSSGDVAPPPAHTAVTLTPAEAHERIAASTAPDDGRREALLELMRRYS
jgi:hypothetical protein